MEFYTHFAYQTHVAPKLLISLTSVQACCRPHNVKPDRFVPTVPSVCTRLCWSVSSVLALPLLSPPFRRLDSCHCVRMRHPLVCKRNFRSLTFVNLPLELHLQFPAELLHDGVAPLVLCCSTFGIALVIDLLDECEWLGVRSVVFCGVRTLRLRRMKDTKCCTEYLQKVVVVYCVNTCVVAMICRAVTQACFQATRYRAKPPLSHGPRQSLLSGIRAAIEFSKSIFSILDTSWCLLS